MGIGLGPHVKRYKDIAMLLVKYGNSDLVKNAGLDEYVTDSKGVPSVPKDAEKTADDLARDIEELGPAFVKLGQLLSTRSDFLPPTYLAALSRLQDNCEPVPFDLIEKRVVTELGVRISKGFREFESTPIAAASLGQIHRAVLRNGREVAVKVQRPGIKDGIMEDLQILSEIAEFYDQHTESGKKYEFTVIADEFRKSVLEELDYKKEAHNLETIRANLKEFELIHVPCPVWDYTSNTVLTMDFVTGKKVTDITRLALLEINGAALAEEIFRAYLKQILVDGFFHADPHPGNVFLTDDKTIGLLDLGMVAHLTPPLQQKLLRMVIAISEGRADSVADVGIDIGERKDNFDEQSFRMQIADLVQNDLNADIEGMQVGRVVLGVTKCAGDCGIRVPAELTMVGKALMNLDQIGRTLDPSFEPNASVRRNAAHIMEQRMRNDLSPGHLGDSLIETKDFLENLPKRINKILDLVSSNKFEMKVIDEPILIDSFQKVANRISLSLILAALIIGAALLMRVPTSFTLWGYPTIAIVCFVAAAIGGFALAVQIAFYDQPHEKVKTENKPPRRTLSK
ncbi:AarF/ABC1/UbiB kinase family protein [Candidatus Obscuribacterales bacterium]|nr:AarF/ABC1/UbiB kinase family protein [Candidatus Obscuribacterales bacterium]MBX3136586.1 AarF/ABC1/UbiB kinase family protein [Candidatus Obscuribacterales bacterium]